VVGVGRHEHREGAAVTYDAGLDVSLAEAAIRVVDAAGTIVKEMRAESAPGALHDALVRLDLPLERVGMEACSLTAWLHDGLTAAGWPALCIETRQANAAMKTMPSKTDRNDARAPLRGPAPWPRSSAPAGSARCTSRAASRVAGARCWSPGGRF
jgi:transposase